MNNDDFNEVLENQLQRCKNVLSVKGKEYADDVDRLRNFKQAAHLKSETPLEALGGMMSKHTVSIYDMIHASEGEEFTLEQWSEKITDHINYLILGRALVVELAMKGN